MNIPESFKDPTVRLEIYKQLLGITLANKDSTSKYKSPAYMCNRLLEVQHEAISDLRGLSITGVTGAVIPRTIPLHVLLPELKPPCLTGPAAWGNTYDYDLRARLLSAAIEGVNLLIERKN